MGEFCRRPGGGRGNRSRWSAKNGGGGVLRWPDVQYAHRPRACSCNQDNQHLSQRLQIALPPQCADLVRVLIRVPTWISGCSCIITFSYNPALGGLLDHIVCVVYGCEHPGGVAMDPSGLSCVNLMYWMVVKDIHMLDSATQQNKRTMQEHADKCKFQDGTITKMSGFDVQKICCSSFSEGRV